MASAAHPIDSAATLTSVATTRRVRWRTGIVTPPARATWVSLPGI
jgi:hypothetical protein